MEKNTIIQIDIEDMSDEGLGIGHALGMAVFVKDSIVGDTVRAKITKVKKNYAYARLEEVLIPSPDRTQAFCPAARACGGCQLQEMSYEAQLRLKQRKVRNNLERIGGFAGLEVLPVIGMDEPYRYRNKAQFPIGVNREGKLIAGFYAGRTHSIIDNHDCGIGIEENRSVLETVLAYMKRNHAAAYDESSHSGIVRHVMTRWGRSTGQLMVVIIASADRLPAEEDLVRSLKEAAEKDRWTCRLTSVVLNTNKAVTNVILGHKNRVLYGQDYIEDRIGDNLYRISSMSFYQVNPVQTEKLYRTALEYAGLTGRENVWDLYCGTGTISLFLARKAGKVTGVEIVPEAIDNARVNAELNGIRNTEFLVGKAEEILPRLAAEQAETAGSGGKIADVIVVDPPRKGLDRIVTETILSAAPDRIVYVSCDSATLARDLRLFSEGGYRIQKVQPVDMFPHTVHVESIALLERVSNRKYKPDARVKIDVDLEDYYRIKDAQKN